MSAPTDEIYAADSYPPAVIPQLRVALSLLRRARLVLDQVVDTRGVQAGSPMEYARDELVTAISYLQVDEDDGSSPPQGPHLVIDNTRGRS
jgi:hypothetical protein